MAKRTVLYDQHVKLSGRIVDFSGWELPVQYEGVLAEHRHTRSVVSAFDCSHMGQFLISGPDAAVKIARVTTQNAESLKVGKCRYGFLLNEDAGVLDDTILMRLGEDEFLLVVNAGTLEGDLAWVKAKLASDLELRNLSGEGWNKVDLQGPEAFNVLSPNVDGLAEMSYFSVRRAKCFGRDCTISRTGYTGELGYEIMAPAEDLLAIFEQLLQDESVKPAGLGARDSLRLEMSYPLYGHELSTGLNPVEADLMVFMKSKQDYLGSAKIRELVEQGPAKKLIAYTAASKRKSNPGNEVIHEGQVVGEVTSGGFAPSLEISIGFAYVKTALSAPGTELAVNLGRAELPITVCEKPLYKTASCRANVG